MCVTVSQSQKQVKVSAKKQRLRRLPHVCNPAKYKRSRSSPRHTGTGKPKSCSRPFDLFCDSQGHIWVCLVRSCLTVHDSVAVCVIVSEILPFENCPLNVCQCHKSRSRSSEVTVGAMPPLDLSCSEIWNVHLSSGDQGWLCTLISRKR